jgi:molybdopterin molybdotransferase
MLSASEARIAVLENLPDLSTESVTLRGALHRALAVDIIAEADIPPFDNSAMDGFALRSDDTDGASNSQPVKLKLAGEVKAGDVGSEPLRPGSSVRIMTGAAIPPGADAVLEQELVALEGGLLEIKAPVSRGRNFRRRGEDVLRGATVLRKGTVLGAASLGVLASLGVAHVEVFRKPKVAILTSGDEVVDVDEPLRPGKIRNSNAYTLYALLEEDSCEPIDLGRARDDEAELRSKISEGLTCDLLVTSGGVSVGKHDLVLKTLKELGVQIKFWKVNIRPGMPMAFGIYQAPESVVRTLVFALPGNPVSTMVTYMQFVRPALRKMTGSLETTQPFHLLARLEHDVIKQDGKRHFTRGILRNEKGQFFVRTTGSQSSGVLSSLVAANCLVIIPEESAEIKAGCDIEVELL